MSEYVGGPFLISGVVALAAFSCKHNSRPRKKSKGNFAFSSNISDDDLTVQVTAQSPDPEEQFIKEQKINLMREVVQRLKPHYKKLIEMRYFKEYSYDEIAQELNLPIGTVKAQLFRSREFLFNILKNSKEKI